MTGRHLAAAHTRHTYDLVKRAVDLVASAVGLLVLSPVLILIAIAVAVNLGGPVLFTQDRPGRGGRVFRLYKFRSMKSVDIERGLQTDEQRLTPFGRALRASSLDELPTLVNVLRGEMSLVGPRPLLVQYLGRYSPEQARRHEVRPGITGLAQSSGRNALGWDEKFALDIHYIDNRNAALDLKIVGMTVKSVLTREGISSAGHATMTEFHGSSRSADAW
ncbi:sugar transferase [Glaciibacter sp. 2TAF33]|uniref:sugar transferase n=1 Tax=Glaciibacter sp. 2TAF33 TaxID=3233015 RepID=UPI003F8E9C50